MRSARPARFRAHHATSRQRKQTGQRRAILTASLSAAALLLVACVSLGIVMAGDLSARPGAARPSASSDWPAPASFIASAAQPGVHSATPAPYSTTPSVHLVAPAPSARPQTAKPSPATPAASAYPTDGGAPIGQLVVVVASGSAAEVSLYELDGGKWVLRLKTDGCVGRAGVTKADLKKEGDMKTPEGLYRLGFAFGSERPDTLMDFRLITPGSYWVDDPASTYYNTWQECTQRPKPWKSAEHLAGEKSRYHYAVVIDYNMKDVPGKGSAIFLHCKASASTSGCVAIPEKEMLEILGVLDPKRNPSILIADSEAAVDAYGLVVLK